jgi:hypothetical protein
MTVHKIRNTEKLSCLDWDSNHIYLDCWSKAPPFELSRFPNDCRHYIPCRHFTLHHIISLITCPNLMRKGDVPTKMIIVGFLHRESGALDSSLEEHWTGNLFFESRSQGDFDISLQFLILQQSWIICQYITCTVVQEFVCNMPWRYYTSMNMPTLRYISRGILTSWEHTK